MDLYKSLKSQKLQLSKWNKPGEEIKNSRNDQLEKAIDLKNTSG